MAHEKIGIDVRMAGSSGIGRYVRNIVPRVIERSPSLDFCLLAPRETYERYGMASWGADLSEFIAPVYGIREQLAFASGIPADCTLFWSPHYNIPLAYRGRLIVTVHDLCHLAHPEVFSGLGKQAYARFMFRQVRTRAAAIVTVSEFSRHEFLRLVGKPRGPIRAIHPGVARGDFKSSSAPDSPPQRPYVLFVGNVKPHKNLRTLLRAFGRVLDRVPHDLIIVGEREGFLVGEPSLAKYANELGSRVRFTGYVDEPILRQYYRDADALVLPSFCEGFGLPVLEAMAAGCPVAASRAASLPEVAGGAALLFDPHTPQALAEVIVRIVTDQDLARRLRERGDTRVRLFTWERSADEMAKVLKTVADA